ncbi:FGGY family carbohydrate kinase [Amphritea sp. 1_MG-2023]|uniref:FGGY family carbohydrate kinase n=1 Tax=Amphritea sp. 1_MG-2023 TaxID=3062670 RepID=UPI0026E12C5A|nr:FGGY family carbohydrate kinase [Amphritea sp. 1_MG-2023]MDO6562187.1 FGGY family carbohydrate kinase [Amphritea sp. 1_MG-2023]
MRTDLCLVMDQGSEYCQALVYDRLGTCLSQGKVPIKTQFTPPNRAEQQPQAILISLKQAALEAISKLQREQRLRLKTAALITQRSSLLCWDADNGQALTPVLSWQDQRGLSHIQALMPLASMIRQLTGLYPNAHLPASKLRWCMEHMNVSNAKHRIRGGPISAWLIQQLLHEQPNLIDAVSAARTMLYSLKDKGWHPELVELFQLPDSLLPSVRPCQFPFGTLNLPGLSLPLNFVSSDQAAALFALGEPSQDNLYIHLGSGGVMNRAITERGLHPQERLLHHLIQAAQQPRYSAEATLNGAANALEWAFNHSRPESRDIDSWIADYPDPPLFMNMIGGVGSPYWQPLERSCWVNDSGNPKAQMVAVMESIIFLICRNLKAMSSLPAAKHIIIDGQASRFNSLCQGVADLSGLTVLRYDQHELPALGAAWQTLPNSVRKIQPDTRFEPAKNPALQQRYLVWIELFEEHINNLNNPNNPNNLN